MTLTAIDAACQILKDAGKPLHYREITRRALTQGLWTSQGKTPCRTINAELSTEIKENGDDSRVRRVSPGHYALAEPPSPAFVSDVKAREIPLEDLTAAQDIRMELLIEPDRTRWMKSRTLWNRFNVKSRQSSRVSAVRAALQAHGIATQLDDHLGSESLDDRVTLCLLTAPAWPDDAWFQRMRVREFGSEAEVEYYFVLDLLKHLGYQEQDLSLHHNLVVHRGATALKMQADIAIFADEFRNDAIMVIEVKDAQSRLTQKAIGQARSYAVELNAPLYLVTNGDDARLFRLRFGAGTPSEIFRFNRSQLKDQWPDIVGYLSRDAVIRHKQELRALLGESD